MEACWRGAWESGQKGVRGGARGQLLSFASEGTRNGEQSVWSQGFCVWVLVDSVAGRTVDAGGGAGSVLRVKPWESEQGKERVFLRSRREGREGPRGSSWTLSAQE